MDAVAHFGAEHVVDEAVLCDPGEALEDRSRDDRVEVTPVSRDLGASAGDPRLDPLLQLIWCGRHEEKPSARQSKAILAEA